MKYLLLLLLFFIACVTEPDEKKPVQIGPGDYRADIFNTYDVTDINGGYHVIFIDGYVRVELNSNGVFTRVEYVSANIDGAATVDSAIFTGLYTQKPGLLCFDDGAGSECETVKDISAISFTMRVPDTELVEMFGKEWLIFIKK